MTDDRARRSRSFGAVAADYAAYRPGYPAAAVEWALPTAASTVLDLGAGTGKLTERLLERPGVTVHAVEPDPSMLDELRARFPTARALRGSAEAIPFPDAAVDVVCVGEAWHWFDVDRAQPEIARVLRPGGVLALVGNTDDPGVGWIRGLRDEMGGVERAEAYYHDRDRMPAHPAFTTAERAGFPNPVPTTIDGLLGQLGTFSWMLTAEPADRDALLARARDYLERRPETASGEFVLPLVTSVLRVLRR